MSNGARVTASRGPTQADVARLAGVAQSTVSQVLNETDGRPARVSPATRGRIQEAARVLGYQPGQRRPRPQRRDVLLGLVQPVAPATRGEIDVVVRRGVEREATLLGCDLVIYNAAARTRGARRDVELDGCIVIEPAGDTADRSCPVVRIEPSDLTAKTSGQPNRAYAVGRTAVRRLVSTL